MGVPDATEHRRNTLEIDIVRQLLDPWIDHRLELVAVRAAIPEQLDNLDLVRLGNRYRILQLNIFLSSLKLCRTGRKAKQAGGNEKGTENEFTHGDSLGNERLTDSATGCSNSCVLASAFRRFSIS